MKIKKYLDAVSLLWENIVALPSSHRLFHHALSSQWGVMTILRVSIEYMYGARLPSSIPVVYGAHFFYSNSIFEPQISNLRHIFQFWLVFHTFEPKIVKQFSNLEPRFQKYLATS